MIDIVGLFCVMCGWENEAAYDEWQNTPLRAKQVEDLAHAIAAEEVKTLSFQSVHVVTRAPST